MTVFKENFKFENVHLIFNRSWVIIELYKSVYLFHTNNLMLNNKFCLSNKPKLRYNLVERTINLIRNYACYIKSKY